jgi:heme oxygenase
MDAAISGAAAASRGGLDPRADAPPRPRAMRGAVRERLRYATRDAHAALDAHPTMRTLLEGQSGRDGYLRLLASYARLYRGLETALDQAIAHLPPHYDWSARRKLPWLDQDLVALGHDATRLEDDPFTPLPPIDSRAAAIGVLYPLEGSTLGGVTIAKRLARVLDVEATSGGRFFHGYGAETGTRWAETCALIETIAHDDAAQEAAAAIAIRIFHCFARALDAAAPLRSSADDEPIGAAT